MCVRIAKKMSRVNWCQWLLQESCGVALDDTSKVRFGPK